MNYIDLKHCYRTPEINAIREFGVMSSGFIRISFFFYTIYYGENIRNILYSIYLIVLTQLDFGECNGKKKSKRIYDIVDYTSRVIFLAASIPGFTNTLYINLDIFAIPHMLLMSGIYEIEHYS